MGRHLTNGHHNIVAMEGGRERGRGRVRVRGREIMGERGGGMERGREIGRERSRMIENEIQTHPPCQDLNHGRKM